MSDAGLPVRVPVMGPLVGLFLDDRDVTDYASARAAVARGGYPEFFRAMLRRGVALAPGPYEVMFPGLAHTDVELDTVVDAAGEAARDVAALLAG